MRNGYRLGPWFLDNWSRAALPFGILMLILLPVLLDGQNLALVLMYTTLPVYMIHQYEEHAHGRFVAEINAMIGGGREILTKVSAFWINIGGVWILYLVFFYLAKYTALGFALASVYLILVNAVVHIVMGARQRSYNPGLYTGMLLFVPWGLFLAIYFSIVVRASLLFNVIGLLFAIAVHAAIVLYVLSQLRRSSTSSR